MDRFTFLDRLSHGFRPFIALSLLCLVLFLPGLATLPPMDRDESRYMQATRQMLETEDYVKIQYQDQMRAKKPVGAYWLQALSVSTFSHEASTQTWPYRLPSFLAAWAAVLVTFAFAQSLVGARPALLGAALLASSLMLVSEAHQAKTDALMLLTVVVTMGIFSRFYVASRTKAISGGGCGTPAPKGAPGIWEALIFWVFVGFSILIKGPVVPTIILLALTTLGIADKSIGWFRTMRPIVGALIAAAIAAPWFILISQATDGAFVGAAIKEDLLPKLLGAHESHGGIPGMYLLLAGVFLWPGSLLLWPAVTKFWANRQRLAIRVLLAWAIPTWIMMEIIPTKLPHYVMPAYPAICLLVAALALEGIDAYRHKAAKFWYVAWCAIGILLAGLVIFAPHYLGHGVKLILIPAAILILVATFAAAYKAWHGQLVAASGWVLIAAVAVYPTIFHSVMPSMDKMFLSRAVAGVVKTVGSDGPVSAVGFHEPSLVFLLGTETKLVRAPQAAQNLADNPRTLAIIADRQDADFKAKAQELGLKIEAFGEVSGLNYSRGKPTTLTVYGVTQ